MSLDPGLATLYAALIALAGAVVGAVAIVIVGLRTLRHQSNLERQKWSQVRREAIDIELRKSYQEMVTRVAELLHSMCWLTWTARHATRRMDRQRIDSYDADAHRLWPLIMGSLSNVASYDYELYESASKIIETELNQFDEKLGKVGAQFDEDPKNAVLVLAELHEPSLEFDRSVRGRLTTALKQRLQTSGESARSRELGT